MSRLAAAVALALMAPLAPADATPDPDQGGARIACPGAGRSWLVPFATAPFPYDGAIPDKGVPFLDVRAGERRGHTSPRGGVYWEDATYADSRVLLDRKSVV